jgi:TonB-linked SusC/RagA family outer membrane protein
MAAVQVFIPGSGIGALSQQNGRYLLLNLPAGSHTISAQRIGYRAASQQVTVTAGQTVQLDFALTEEALGLDEIIVTGTPGGTQRRAIGNAVTAISAAEITQNVAVNTMQDLLGARTPGLQFNRVNGNIGTGSPMQIRGTSSFNLTTNPLIFVDGVRVNNNAQAGPSLGDSREVNPLSDFNPADIESVEIIKGPAAATLYGTEASAGVIQIITKRGSQGTAQFEMSVTQGANYLRDPAGRVGERWSCMATFAPPCDETRGGIFAYNPYDEANWLIEQGAYPYQQKRLYEDGHTHSYNMDVRGGTQAFRYFMSGGYDDDGGIVWYNYDKTFRLRANVSTVFSEQITFDLSSGFVRGKTGFMQQARGDGGEWEDMVWGNGYCQPRINPGRDGKPLTADDPCPRLMGFQEHLPSDVARIKVTRDYQRFTGSGTLNVTPAEWLTSRAIVGLDMGWDENSSIYPLELTTPPTWAPTIAWPPVYFRMPEGEVTIGRPKNSNISLDMAATAKKGLMGVGTATSVGLQYYLKNESNFEVTGIGFSSPLSTTINQTPASKSSIAYTFIDNKSLGMYVQEQLSWRDRLFLTGAVRFDDNSAFGSEFDFEKYPKLAATWVVSDEGFWAVDLVNSLRLRGAWGQAGRQPDAFARVTRYGVATGPGGIGMLDPKGPGNAEVGPERSSELELGFDVAVLDDRVSGEFTWFRKKTEDALLNVAVSPSVGLGNVAAQRNLGQIDNWGWEATLTSRLYESPTISVGLDLTGSHVDNEIKGLGDFPGTQSIKIGYPYPNYTARLVHVDARFDNAGLVQNAWGQKVVAICAMPASRSATRRSTVSCREARRRPASRSAASISSWGARSTHTGSRWRPTSACSTTRSSYTRWRTRPTG